MPFRLGVIGAVLAVSLAVAGAASAANQNVSALPSDEFSPDDVTINVGDTVTWSNTGGNHNVVLDEGNTALNAPSTSLWTLPPRAFNQAGTFRYYCEIHGDPGGVGMSGIVRVVAPTAPPGPPSPAPPGGNPPGGNPPGGNPPGGGPGEPGALSVTLKASDTTPRAGARVRLFGVVKPARDGRKVSIQRRLKNGKFKTIAAVRLKAAAGDKSVYSLRLRLSADAVLRARVAGDAEATTGLSKGRKLDVHKRA